MKPKSIKVLTGLLSCLRALHQTHWTSHWQAQGDSFYGDHLLFERMYTSIPDEADTLAEKMVAVGGNSLVSLGHQGEFMLKWIQRWAGIHDLLKRSLQAEEDLQVAIKTAYDTLKEGGDLTLGMDDYLMALASSHETHLFLLRQRFRSPVP